MCNDPCCEAYTTMLERRVTELEQLNGTLKRAMNMLVCPEKSSSWED